MTEYRQMIRGTDIELDGFLGLEGMRAYSTDSNNMRLYDGILIGGYTVLNADQNATLYTLPDRLTADGKLILIDANTAIEAGFYRVVGTEANLPVANQGAIWVGASADSADGDVVQIYCRSTGTAMYERVRSNAVWSAWVQIMDITSSDARYLGIGATAVDSALLNGQNAAFYTNIVARLGYTPLNKAGDTMLGALILSTSSPATGLEATSKTYVDTVVNVVATTANNLAANAVRFDTAQVHTPFQMSQARENASIPWAGTIAGLNGSMPNASFTLTMIPGECMSQYNIQDEVRMVGPGWTKSCSNPWVAGNANGAVDLNTSIPATAAFDSYHVYIIAQSAAPFGVDYCVSLSAVGPTVGVGSNIPATWDRYRRLASFRMNNAGATGWNQRGNETLMLIPNVDISQNVNAAAASLITVTSVPTGVIMGALTHLQGYKAGTQISMLITAPDQTDSAVSAAIFTWFTTAAAGYVPGAVGGPWRTNTAAQIRARSDTALSSLFGMTRGWIDERGQYGSN